MRNNNGSVLTDIFDIIGMSFETGGMLIELLTLMFWAGVLVLVAPFWLFWVIVKGLCDIA